MTCLLYSYNVYVITNRRCDSAEFSYNTDRIVYVAGFYSQLASKVIRTGSVQVVVYLERHVVSSLEWAALEWATLE